MRRAVRLVIFLILIGGLIGGGWMYFSSHPDSWKRLLVRFQARPMKVVHGIEASGIIEAQIVSVTSETGGRVMMIAAEEGDEVAAGQVLVQLNTSLIDAEIKRAEAALGVAQAGLDLARAGAQPAAIAQAEALLQQARIAAQGAWQVWEDAKAIRDAPKELDVKLAAAKNEAALAEGQVKVAELLARAADLEQAMYERLVQSLKGGIEVQVPGPKEPITVRVPAGPEKVAEAHLQWNIASQRTWQAYAKLNEVKAARDAALQTVRDLQAQLSQPMELDAQVHAAEAAYHEAEAAVKVAESVVDDLKAGARPEDIAVAQAAVDEARSALRALQVQRAKMTLTAPMAGLITERNVSVGEIVAAGASVMRIANLDQVTLTIYIPEHQLGRVKLGQRVEVRVDSFPGKVFEGAVRYIASEAEFTPKSVQTREERMNLVFAVKVDIPNPDHELKPGMPADAVILTEGS